MSLVSRDKDINMCTDRAYKDQVVIRIARERPARCLGRWRRFHRHISEKFLDRLPALSSEAELLGEDPLEFAQCGLQKYELQIAIDCLFDDPAGWAGGDECGHQDVGVTGDTQNQRRRARSSSTRASLSSGPIPDISARS